MTHYPKERPNRSKITSGKSEIMEGLAVALVLAITLSSMEAISQNDIQAQTTMYKCTPDMGVNVSMVNCLTNDTADTYYESMVTEMRQNHTREGSQYMLNGTTQTATQGMETAMNETAEALSNVTGGIMEGFKNVVNGSNG